MGILLSSSPFCFPCGLPKTESGNREGAIDGGRDLRYSVLRTDLEVALHARWTSERYTCRYYFDTACLVLRDLHVSHPPLHPLTFLCSILHIL